LKAKEWDNKPIDMNYFDELFRISKNQIIWGGNYYALPPTKHCIIWDKMHPNGTLLCAVPVVTLTDLIIKQI